MSPPPAKAASLSPSQSTSPSSSTSHSPSSIVLSTPPPLLSLLAFEPFLALVLSFLQILNWKQGSRFAALSVTTGWVLVCLSGRIGMVASVGAGVWLFRRSGRGGGGKNKRRASLEVVGEGEGEAVQDPERVVKKLVTLQKLKEELELFWTPQSPILPPRAWKARTLVLALALVFLLPPHISLLFLGLAILTLRAPFTPPLVKLATFWTRRGKSAIRSTSKGVRFGAGSAGGKEEEREGKEKRELLVLFTVCENQRWWMGLDWTAALLPNERASWTDIHNNPVSPPSSFQLPPSTVLTTSAPTSKSPNRTIRKTLEWKWVDNDWEVKFSDEKGRKADSATKGTFDDWKNKLKSHGGSESFSSSSNVKEREKTTQASPETNTSGIHPPPSPAKESGEKKPSVPSATNLATSTLGNYLASSLIPSSISNPAWVQFSRSQPGSGTTSTSNPQDSYLTSLENVAMGSTEVLDGWEVDNEGWQYGDNHWEKMGSKGGMGRYTRRRAWWRRAVLVEVVEVVEGKPKEKKEKEKEARKRRSSSRHSKPKIVLSEKEKEKLKEAAIEEEESPGKSSAVDSKDRDAQKRTKHEKEDT
ncbi:hypothetical protein BT69DRAFT_1317983 [Atractiella rhizophila]|nr:hypothetical protein BT69DRAFT_1317983 [Atractiella rhizophila]